MNLRHHFLILALCFSLPVLNAGKGALTQSLPVQHTGKGTSKHIDRTPKRVTPHILPAPKRRGKPYQPDLVVPAVYVAMVGGLLLLPVVEATAQCRNLPENIGQITTLCWHHLSEMMKSLNPLDADLFQQLIKAPESIALGGKLYQECSHGTINSVVDSLMKSGNIRDITANLTDAARVELHTKYATCLRYALPSTFPSAASRFESTLDLGNAIILLVVYFVAQAHPPVNNMFTNIFTNNND